MKRAHRITLLVAIGALLSACATTVLRGWDIPPPLKPQAVNGYDMAFLEKGAGDTVVFVHGSTSDYRVWARQFEPVAQGHRVLAVNLRHHYPEPWDGRGAGLSLRQHVADLREFIRIQGGGSVHLVGISRGAQVALQLATEEPGLLRSLVLADPAPVEALMAPSPPAAAALADRRGYVDAAVARLRQGDTEGALERFIDGVQASGAWRQTPEAARQVVRANAWSLLSLPADAREPLTCRAVGSVGMPVLLLNGEHSPDLYRLMLDALQACLRSPSRRVVIPQAGHGMQFQNPQAFNAVLLDFLAHRAP